MSNRITENTIEEFAIELLERVKNLESTIDTLLPKL